MVVKGVKLQILTLSSAGILNCDQFKFMILKYLLIILGKQQTKITMFKTDLVIVNFFTL